MKLTTLFLLLALVVSCTPEQKNAPKNELPTATEFHPQAVGQAHWLMGQTVYVPIYSSIYVEHEKSLVHLTATLSLRNTSEKEPITITRVSYYDTNGVLKKNFIEGTFSLGKMATKDFVISTDNLTGGTGANFIVEWKSATKVSTPVIESVMVGTMGTHGFSFTSRGQEVESH